MMSEFANTDVYLEGGNSSSRDFFSKLFDFVSGNTEVSGGIEMTPERKKLLKRWHFLSNRVDDMPDPSGDKFP